jgi:hypothetical protein
MVISLILLVIGLVLLVKGADWLVDGASVLAKKKNVSDLAIGLTIVAFGTSAPELIVNAIAATENYPEIVFGNVIGSNDSGNSRANHSPCCSIQYSLERNSLFSFCGHIDTCSRRFILL